MILDIYKDSFEFASKKISVLLLLGVLSFFSILIVPLVFVYGYDYRVIKQSAQSMINGEDEPPEFGDYKKMFIDGLRYFVVYLIYMIIPIILLSLSTFNGSFNVILFSIGIIAFVIASLLLYLAIPNMASNDDSFKSAFAFSDINNVMSSIGYGGYILTYCGVVLISIVIFFVAAIIISILFMILGIASLSISTSGFGAISSFGTIIFNFVMLFLVAPYLTLFQHRCQGLLYGLGS